ncbi:LacI family DNA-binding transcriptional regulator [Paracoccus spongiarum]|uniref:LacI family DNA-binding transcriptional regulator n=1 Tax=Paracoccus spongiarum TaxID=3064387 RepID=A0ABT9JFX4_9RHOB|nr:LacI family DNA-binding transcriptional regulator [Paracoccus sp. 2205BS29-5]MDP5308722.1 LacI family DNA-binding transcriptional regulator [Paracoccus sp. 2205BS29-5]
MIDIARAAGVSPMTVSRAFKNAGLVSPTARAAVMQAADDLGYVFDSAASALRSQRSDFVAVIIPSINNANFADTVRGLSDGLRARGLQILLGYTDYDVEAEEVLIAQLLRRRPEAMVVTGGTHTDRARVMLDKAAIPVIEMWDLPAHPIGHVVGFSNAAAMGTLVDHLAAIGRRRMAFIGGDAARDTRGTDRRRGFVAAVRRHGLDATRLIDAGPPPISMAEGAAAMADLLERMPDTDAVVCVSDLSAFGALTECQRRGIAVPDQVAVAGFGDYEIAAVCVPPLTTVNPFPLRIGHEAADLILKALDDELPGPTILRVAPELQARASSLGVGQDGRLIRR